MKKYLTLLFLFATVYSFSQTQVEEKKDVKVGLVLSGGGAKGFAHIGVLKVLEEAGVRVDYVGGTSMGAIIGSLYASGYTAKEIDSLVRTFDFDKLMQDDIPRKAKPFYEKKNGEKYAISFPVKKGKVGIPVAISKGQNILNLTTKLLQHVDTITDFKDLPIPFLCIATDLENGKEVILDKGFLPKAIQASGAFPTLLAPVEIDDRILIDGGVVNNFPVAQVKEMGADFIIGVDLKSDFEKDEGLASAVTIINQIVNFQMYENHEERIKLTDLYLHPNLNSYKVTSFDKLEEIQQLGEDIARLNFEEFKNLAALQSEKRKPFKKKENPKEIYVKRIDIEGNEDYNRTYIKGKMKLFNNTTIQYQDLVEGVNNLAATGNFSDIQYKIIEEDDGSIIKVKVKQERVSTHVKFAVHYDNLYKTGVLANITAKHLLSKNDVLSADLILGDNFRYNFDYFIDNGTYWSFGLKSRYNSFNTDISVGDNNFDLGVNKLDLNYSDFTNQLYFQTVFNRKFALGVGVEHKRLNVFTETLIPSNPNEPKTYFDKSDYGNLISYLKFDTYDKKYFQKEGALIDVNFRWYLLSTDYNDDFYSFSQLQGKFGYAHTFFNKLTAHITSEVAITIGENDNDALDFNLGGYGDNYINTFVPHYGYEFASLSGNAFLRSTLKLRYEVFENHYLMGAANAARVEDDIFNKGRIFEDTKLGYGVGYGFDSFLGPIEINYTWSPDTDNNYWYFNLGYWF